MPRLTIARGAGLIYNGQAPLKQITYDESDKDIISGQYIRPINETLYGSFNASGMSVSWTESAHDIPAATLYGNSYTNFSFYAFDTTSSHTPYLVQGIQEDRSVTFQYIVGWDSGTPIYQIVTETVKDFLVKWTYPGQTETVWTVATGGVRIFDNPDRTQYYVRYDWDDVTYGQPNKKIGFTATSVFKDNNAYYTSIHPNIIDKNSSGDPYYPGSNSYYFRCTFDNPGIVFYNVTITNLTATNRTD